MPISHTLTQLWRAQGSGYPNEMLPPSDHIARMRWLLQSGDLDKVQAAVNAVKL